MATPNGTPILRALAFSLAAAGMAATGCGGATETAVTEDVGRAIQPIIKGTPSGTENDSVVLLVTYVGSQPAFLCTATLVAPNLALTARHCVADVTGATGCGPDGNAAVGGEIAENRDPASLAIFVGKNGTSPAFDDKTKASAVATKLVTEDATNVCSHDLAFLVLDRAVDAPTAALRLTPLAAGETVAAVGYGVDDSGSLSKDREIRSGLTPSIGPALYPDDPKYGYGPNEFMLGESVCAGDSGGPALDPSGAVLGVAARAGNGQERTDNYASTCTGPHAHAVYTSLAAHADLVGRALQAAGVTAKVDGPTAATTGTPATAPSTTTTSVEVAATPAAAAASGGGGCSMTSEPQKGSVEYAAGLVALLASLVGLRRRLGKHDEEEAPAPRLTRTRDRLPSLP